MIDRPDEYAREVAEARSNMAYDPKRHDKDCDYHVDQYPWECNCGVLSGKPDYPAWVCGPCGDKYGRRECGIATWHEDECGVCGQRSMVTEPRDFGHLKDGWENGNE